MLYVISYHAPDVPEEDRPDKRSVEAPLEIISKAIQQIRTHDTNVLGQRERESTTCTSYFFNSALFVLVNNISALRIISESHERISEIAENLRLHYDYKNVFSFFPDKDD